MKDHIQYFKNHGLKIESEDGVNLKIHGLSSLPGEVKKSVLKYAREHKNKILFDLADTKINRMPKCLHGLPCHNIYVDDHRHICRKNNQPIFDLDQCPIGKWFQPGKEYKKLWAEAWDLADWVDDPEGAPIKERRARLPELLAMVARIDELDKSLQGVTPDISICRACNGQSWWRLNEPGSKRICTTCHPPASGIDVIFEDLKL